jgi:hypothetical protein
MPNWTANTIRAEGSARDIRAFLETVKSKNEIFDFNRLIPMPKLLEHTASGGRDFDGKKCHAWYVENPDAPFGERIERPFTNDEEAALREIGYTDWYEWSVVHWGTKWNACRALIAEQCANGRYVVITLDTAWSPPLPVFRAMFGRFPALSFTCTWRDECETEVYSIERRTLAVP